ncbi:MAG TPA: flagellar basal-body rod protein FlgF [Caulobacteraceae bacterium]
MDNVLYVGLSRQMVLQHEMDVIANNVANVDTTGFKVEALMVQTDPEKMQTSPGSPLSPSVNFPLDAGVVRDFTQGELKPTGGALNMAIQGQGFFKVSTPNGERYTRDGAFTLDAQGRLVTADGDTVEGEGGDITLDPVKGPLSVSADGTISQQGQVIGKLGVVTFSSLSALTKQGDGLYSNDTNLQPQASPDAKIRQGMLEQSNVQPITQITRLIQVSRAYENVSQMMDQTGQLSSNAVDRLGKLTTN